MPLSGVSSSFNASFYTTSIPDENGVILPVPLARKSSGGYKKPIRVKNADRFLSKSRQKSMVIRTGSRKVPGMSRDRAKVHDRKEEPARESLMSTRSDVFGVIKIKSPVSIHRPKNKNAENSIGSNFNDHKITGDKSDISSGETISMAEQKKTGSVSAQPSARLSTFVNAETTLAMIQASRWRREQLYFNVPVNLSPPFEMYFSFPINSATIHDGDIVFFQALCEDSHPRDREYHIPGSTIANVYSAMTISAVSVKKLKQYHLSKTSILQGNSFKLVEYRGRQEDTNLLLVWYRYRSQTDGGSSAAITEIMTEKGKYQLTDKNTGYNFSSDNLNDFIAGIERVTGLKFDSENPIEHTAGYAVRYEIAFNSNRNFFISANDTSQSNSELLDLRINEADDLFTSVDAANKKSDDLIYRGCFKFSGDKINYIDLKGIEGELNFRTHPRNPLLLRYDSYGEAEDFLSKKGILRGYFYSKDEISNILTDYYYTAIGDDVGKTNSVPRLDNFYISEPLVSQ